MTFNTGNNVPSTDPRDLYDNAENLDKLVNGVDPFYADRKGILRESWAGMENTFATSQTGRENAFTLSQADKESRFQAFLVSSGYVSKGDYAVNVVLAERNEYVAVDAATTGTSAGLYRPNASATLPLTLTGVWATDSANLVLLGDDVLRQELANNNQDASGAGLIGFMGETVLSALQSLRQSAVTLVPAHFDILSLEQGATDPAAEAGKWESLRLAAESQKAQVFIPSGTYVLPQGVRLDADDTVWTFSPGSLIKLHDTQATNDFVVFQAPQNQRVQGLRIDGNRAAQDAALFGIDNCACLVYDATGCVFEDTEIVSSPAKGFGLVSSAGGTNRDVEIRGFKAADCDMQALLIDGNNMTGLFERITITGVRIGATSHAGVALNDGAHDITMSNVIADVQNSTWDAVFIRDSWDIQCSNVRGKRGRNGVQVQRLNGFCGRIQLDNVVGELSAQNGVLFLGVENVTGGAVTGRNNGAAGINVAATSDGYRCKNINIAAPCGYDDRATTAQQWGILVQGVDGCRLGKHIAFGNTTRNVSINRSATSAVEADIYRVVEVATGSIAATSQAAITATFAETMDDATNDVQAYVTVGTTGRSLAVGHVVSRTASAVQILVHNLHGSVAQEGTLVVRVTRRP